MIHPSAVIHPLACLGEAVNIGPFCRIGERVIIGDRCVLDSHVVFEGPTTIGNDNRFYPFCVIGVAPQDLKYANEETFLTIGSHNTFREYVNVHRGTKGGEGIHG
jgi:UDP-N-acetylglucosamine acyltransferase